MDCKSDSVSSQRATSVGWETRLARLSMAALVFEVVTGLAITLLPFHAAVQWSVLLHTVMGALALLPLAWYCARHWRDYRHHAASQVTVLGYAGLLALAVCALSGVALTWQGLFALRISGWLRQTHLISTLVTLAALGPHVVAAFVRVARLGAVPGASGYAWRTLGATALGLVVIAVLAAAYSGARHTNVFPEDYSYHYGTNRPFAPSLARTDTGGAFDAPSLAGSRSCGTAGCHDQIVEEWLPSAHRYAAMDPVFQGIQNVMAQQNGPESTRYCGGCHDPISLFSGTKNIFVENLTGLHGYREGVSCLACHAIRETDIKGNASYTVTQPREYLWQWQTNGLGRVARDFLLRTYPDEHNKLGKRAFKKPEYCAACHKQFIDQEVNRVGWVQLQNQYDNWAASHWNHKGDARKTIECRECHMPLVASRDPAAGDAADYNRTAGDRQHRSHRFLGANQLVPQMCELEGAEQQTKLIEAWLQGKMDIPEIRDKWRGGAIVNVSLRLPPSVAPGESIPLRVVLSSNRVGHDFPTGPLDIIQSWLEIHVTDDAGRAVFSSGRRDEKNFIEPGTFLFKAEPVDQHGNLIDRHNLWEMVGVRYRRALFPGYSDTVQFTIPCSAALAPAGETTAAPAAAGPIESELTVEAPVAPGKYHLTVILQYRKVDQFLLNYIFGDNKYTAPVTEIARATATVEVKTKTQAALPSARAVAQADGSSR
jgi:hypothetical protein